ncbi:hypothetical protein CK221_03110 [Mesorhizobium sp. WSM3868]|nr:hypothetical protein CK221_03110 [Mesorhizobium sp. WSM3868]
MLPHKIHTIFTDNGIQVKNREQDRSPWSKSSGGEMHRAPHEQGQARSYGLGLVERMNLTIKEAPVRL